MEAEISDARGKYGEQGLQREPFAQMWALLDSNPKLIAAQPLTNLNPTNGNHVSDVIPLEHNMANKLSAQLNVVIVQGICDPYENGNIEQQRVEMIERVE